MKKIILLFAILFATMSFGQKIQTFGTKVRFKKTPSLSVPDSLVTKDSDDILRTTSIADFVSLIDLSEYLQNVVEDTSPQLGDNLDLNFFNIIGTGDIQIVGGANFTTTLLVNGQTTLQNEVLLTAFPSSRNDGSSLNYLFTDGSGNLQSGEFTATTTAIQVACSDLITNVLTGTSKCYFRMPYEATLKDVRVSLFDAGTVTGITVDINEGGFSVLSTLLTTDATEKTSTTATTPAVISDSLLADDAEMTIDFDGVPTAGKGIIISLIITK